jgi:peroxiredoxin
MPGKSVKDFSLPSTGGTFRLCALRGSSAQFGVIKMNNMYGRKLRGIERSTFVIDKSGALAREWRGVKVPGHAQEVLDFAETL